MVDIDWLQLWRELVIATGSLHEERKPSRRYEVRARRKATERYDPLLDFVLQDIDSQTTVLDVGAGNGRWTIPVAQKAGSVTAIEPSDSIRETLRSNIASAELTDIQIVSARWEEAAVEKHDIVVCAHAMYASPDFAGFVRKMERCADKKCYLALRLPPQDGIVGELSHAIYGSYHDSPNAIIAYNALYSMGIYANVLVEEGIRRWIDTTFEGALARAKRHLRLGSSDIHDGLIRDTLTQRLTRLDGSYVWPDGMRSALLWWNPTVMSE